MSERHERSWRPSASLEVLSLRAALLAEVRAFFRERSVLEVETPALAAAGVTDVHLEGIEVRLRAAPGPFFLQTSPEFAMKRLLAAGSGPIYQICRVFRDGEVGRRHNPEFTMVEWYRPGFDDHALIGEVEQLLARLLPAELRAAPAERWRYRELFLDRLGVDPVLDPVARLREAAGPGAPASLSERDELLDYLLTHRIEPGLATDRLVTVHSFPASQAALARLAPDPDGTPVARRFEVWAGGLELANGYWELTDADEQRERFERDLAERRRRDLPAVPLDEHLLDALDSLPDCAGVALGFDRVVMLAARAASIRDVLAFPIDRA